MANWNLSVDLRGRGTDLARTLRESAKHARRLDTAVKSAVREVRELGQASRTAATGVRMLGREARQASRHLRQLGTASNTAARHLGRYGDAARDANRHVNSMGDHSRTAARQLARMSGQINTAVRDLTRLAQAAQRANSHMTRIGDSRALRRYAADAGRARHQIAGLVGLLSGGGLLLGAHQMVENGNELQQAMNTFGAVTGATRMQMQRAAATATQLGNDLALPGATAVDAAEAMVELAKAGFRTDQAISATRASLILSSAAQVNAADSAKYLGDMMDQFGMGADQASVAADTLAATANAASGDIIDIYYAMKYAGPVAHGLGVTMQEAAAAVGMLGKAGILGQTAGTTLRGMMANLAAPTPQMIEGLHAMGIEAWDAAGNFKGLRYVIDGLSKAQHRMTQQDFAAAVKKAMGKPAMSGAIALAHQGTDSFDNLMGAVTATGAAAEIAAAKGKGLAGAMLQLKTQAKQTGLVIYDGLAPGLEFITRGLTNMMAKATPKIQAFFKYLNDAAVLFGPDIAAEVRSRFSGVSDAVEGMLKPFKTLGGDALSSILHLLLSVGDMAVKVLGNLASGVQPVISALGDLSGESGAASGALDLVVTAIDLAASAASALSGVLVPIGHVIGGLVSAFGTLPGPIQQFVLAALLTRRIAPLMDNLTSRVTSAGGAVRNLAREWGQWRAASTTTGATMSRLGAGFAMLESRIGVVSRMADSFRTASASGGRFAGTLRGITTAAGVGLRGAMSGLVGALGGPWGVALAAAGVGLGMLASHQQKAAAAAAEHKQQINNLSQALRESNGLVDENVRAIAAENLMAQKVNTVFQGQQRLVDVARQAKIPMSQLVDAYTNQGTSLKELQGQLNATADAHRAWVLDPDTGSGVEVLDKQGQAASDLAKGLTGLGGDFQKAAADAKAYNEAVKGASGGETAYGRLKDAVAALADKTADADSRTRALRQALDLLSGGSVSLQAAEARVNEALTQANDAMASGINHADGWGKALIGANGALDTTSKNGQNLFNTLNNIADASSSAAVAAFDFAQSQGKDVGPSVAAAQQQMQKARDSAIDLLGKYGLLPDQAAKVADAMGLIPSKVGILLETKGVDSTMAELLAVQAELEGMPNSKTVKVDTLSEDAKKKLEDFGFQVELIPGTREYKITVRDGDARQKLTDFMAAQGSVPPGKTFTMSAKTQGAISDLEALKRKVQGTHGKTITMRVPTAEGRRQLEALGYKIRSTKGKTVTISVPTGSPRGQVAAIQAAINSLHGKTVTNYVKTHYSTPMGPTGKPLMRQARGGVVDYYADGGMRERHTAQIAPAGSWRVWAEPETGGESYIPLAPGKRPRSRAIAEETVRRLGGDPRSIQWNADGNVTDWRYDPQTGSLYSTSDAGQAGHRTRKVKVKGKHGKVTIKEIEYFDIRAVERKLKSAAKATAAWNKDLETIASRVGGDVAEALANMGEDGVALAKKMAHGSTKYINQMAKALRDLQKTARASLTDYTRQLSKVNTTNTKFQSDLAKLAAMGFGDLAAQLAAQGDEAAQQLAAAAVKDHKKASKANAAAKKANSSLTADQVTELVQIIAAVTSSKTGIHQVADKTGLGEDEIIDVASKATGQIRLALGGRGTKFLSDLARAQKGLSYASGGIRAGMYATQGGIVRFAEPQTHGEAYVPFAPDRRRQATAVLSDVAHRFGLGLTDAASNGRVVIVHEKAPVIGSLTIPVQQPRATAHQIADTVAYQMRRAQRGGARR